VCVGCFLFLYAERNHLCGTIEGINILHGVRFLFIYFKDLHLLRCFANSYDVKFAIELFILAYRIVIKINRSWHIAETKIQWMVMFRRFVSLDGN
jgi:hypothetical protein